MRVAPPANADFSAIPPLPNDENPYHLARAAKETGSLGLIEDGWPPIGHAFEFLYELDADRDTNGAGLVYFVDYVTVMERAERAMAEDGQLPGANDRCGTAGSRTTGTPIPATPCGCASRRTGIPATPIASASAHLSIASRTVS